MTASRRPWYVGALLTGLGGLLLVVAAAVRWAPCLGDVDGPGCVARQSRAFDYLVPVQPYAALAGAAVPAGTGLLLIAAAWLYLTRRLRVRPALRSAILAVMLVKPAALGLLVLAAPVVGGLPRGTSVVVLIGGIVLDVAALVLVLASPSDRLADYQRLLVATVAYWMVGWVGQTLDALLFGLFDPEATVAPGAGLLTGVVVIICGGGIAALTATAQERTLPTRRPGDPLERPAHG